MAKKKKKKSVTFCFKVFVMSWHGVTSLSTLVPLVSDRTEYSNAKETGQLFQAGSHPTTQVPSELPGVLLGLPPYLVYQAGVQQETDDMLKTDNVRELKEGTVYRAVGSFVCVWIPWSW